jgi:hypothetical protein
MVTDAVFSDDQPMSYLWVQVTPRFIHTYLRMVRESSFDLKERMCVHIEILIME